MHQIYSQIINLVKNNISNVDDNYVQFSDPAYKPFNFNKNNFNQIKNIENNNKIIFINGGSSEIIKSLNFSLNLMRVYYLIYQKIKDSLSSIDTHEILEIITKNYINP